MAAAATKPVLHYRVDIIAGKRFAERGQVLDTVTATKVGANTTLSRPLKVASLTAPSEGVVVQYRQMIEGKYRSWSDAIPPKTVLFADITVDSSMRGAWWIDTKYQHPLLSCAVGSQLRIGDVRWSWDNYDIIVKLTPLA